MLHKNLPAADNHIVYSWTYANATARNAATGFALADLGKVAWQLDDNSLYLLTATTPSWTLIGAMASMTDVTLIDFDTAGEILIAGAAGWADITSDINVKGNGANNPAWTTFRNGISAYEFSASVMQEAWLNFHPNHNYAPGTDFYLHAHFASTSTGTGTVRMGFEYSVAKGHGQGAGSVFPASTTVYAEFNYATNRQYEHIVLETAALTDPDFEVDALVLCRVFRDAAHINDTFPGTIHLFTADVHHQINRYATKNRAPNFYT
jgi:hypothetical protein